MRTTTAHLRKGVASRILDHIIEEAERRRYRRLSLETGGTDEFEPARTLYASRGFEYCGPFADYAEDSFSVFMTRRVSTVDPSRWDADLSRQPVLTELMRL